jgi:plastocyanin
MSTLGTRPRFVVACLSILALALVACTGAGPSASVETSTGAELSMAPASQATTARCALTPDASKSVTVSWSFFVLESYTIEAGEAVAFATPRESTDQFTVTEGTNGTAAADACIDEPLTGGHSLKVTFYQPGDYDIFCRIAIGMHTVIHVQ